MEKVGQRLEGRGLGVAPASKDVVQGRAGQLIPRFLNPKFIRRGKALFANQGINPFAELL